jgi:hypothetical protein
MANSNLFLLLAMTMAACSPLAQDAGNHADNPPRVPREVSVTKDSAPGWVPSAELEDSARRAASAYLDALDQGHFLDAYALRADNNRQDSFDNFSDRVKTFNALSGAVIERRLTKITWTKNPANAPAPGIYAAIDLVSSFKNIDRDCGYVVLYQPPAGGDFRVIREENAYLDNATAQQIFSSQSSVGVDKAWASLSSRCPNYPRNMPAAPRASTPPIEEDSSSDIGYATVAGALENLRLRQDVAITVQNGWVIVADQAAKSVWSFAPPGHPAYPAAVRRQAVETAQGTALEMKVLCEASKQACDDLVREFQQLNARNGRKH